jgi:hypothetical protein
MKRKLTVLLLTVVVALGLLLGISPAEAQPEVQTNESGLIAHGILNLEVAGVLYNVAFRAESTLDVYGDPPAFDFPLAEAAEAAALAVRDALNNVPTVEAVGPPGGTDLGIDIFNIYQVGIKEVAIEPFGEPVRLMIAQEVVYIEEPTEQDWGLSPDPDVRPVNDPTSIADFTIAEDPPPAAVTIGGNVTGLVGSGLVLQNNGGDDLPRDSDGSFTFATPLIPGTFYSVTVATPPSDPAQTCSVANGSGKVPTVNVTDVAVSCAEEVVSDVSKVAAEGDTLPGDTLLKEIIPSGGVAINASGKVAFHGKTAGTETANIDALFTQDGLVVQENRTLSDDSILTQIIIEGGVAINGNGKVAFHGQVESGVTDDDAVFTEAGVIAKEGQTLSGGRLLDEISSSGGVAINDLDEVAFHGKIEVEGGLIDELIQVVLTSDGVAAQEGDELDGSTLAEINELGGVAINNAGQVAFHGNVFDPDFGNDEINAVFTSDGLVARVGGTLLDDTIVDEIDLSGGVAINDFGKVAFHGKAGGVRAVFTQDGVVAKEGDTLPDGTVLTQIGLEGGVAINDFDKVAFLGRAVDPEVGPDAADAVLTSDGLVARVGDNLTDGITTLTLINESGGVSINDAGQVTFHGKGGGIDAVLVGQSPVAEGDALAAEGDYDGDYPVADGEEMFSE